MKKLILIALTMALLMAMPSMASAHPGRTDGNGGHVCRTNCDDWGVPWNQWHSHNGGSASTPPPIKYWYNGVAYTSQRAADQAKIAHEANEEAKRLEMERIEAERIEAARIATEEAEAEAEAEAEEASATAAAKTAEKAEEASQAQETTPPATLEDEPEEQSGGSSFFIWIIMIVGGLAVIGYFQDKKKKQENE